jgi:DNA-binding transcriptional ArsR family regulator
MNEDDLIEALKALAHPLRWRILTALIAGERNVGEIEAATGISQPGLSQQLGVLRKAGLVETRKEAKLVFYALANKQIEGTLARIAALVSGADASPDRTSPSETPAPGVANFARMF